MTGETQFGENKAYFASVAETYDRLQPIVAGPSYDVGLGIMVDLVPYDRDDVFRFVELGCGTATLTCRVLDRFPGSKGIAIDGEPAMLEVARSKLEGYQDRVEVHQADILTCDLSACDVVLSSYVFHHVAPERLKKIFSHIVHALRPDGCFLLLDGMTAGPVWGKRVAEQRRRLYHQHIAAAIAAGRTTEEEVDARWAFKRRMKEEGKDIEYRHSAEQLLNFMSEVGFQEVGLVWRMFATTILVGFVS